MSRRRAAPSPLAAPPAPGLALVLVGLDSVRADLTIPAGVTRVWLWRVSPSGASAFVRGAVDLQVTPSTTLNIYDFEAPLGVPLTYYARSGNDLGETSAVDQTATTEVPAEPSDDPWLMNIANPANSQRVTVEALTELDYEVPAGVHRVVGRRDPIVTSDVASTPSFDLSFFTAELAQRDQARATLGDGLPVLLRTHPDQGVGNLYLSVLGWGEQRPSRIALHDDRRFRVRGQEVARPDPKLFVPAALIAFYSDVLADFDDYAEAKALNDTYEALALTYGVPAGGVVVPWPPRDV